MAAVSPIAGKLVRAKIRDGITDAPRFETQYVQPLRRQDVCCDTSRSAGADHDYVIDRL